MPGATSIPGPHDPRHSSHDNELLPADERRHSSARPPEIAPMQRMLAACSGSLLTSLLVTPLDVVRVRLQAQQTHPAPTTSTRLVYPLPATPTSVSTPQLGVTACCREVFWISNPTECFAAPSPTPLHSTTCTLARPPPAGTWATLAHISRAEGIPALYRGLSPTLLMAIPANVIYFTGYDYLRSSPFSPLSSLGPTWSPLIAGSAARAIAATAISPLEMFKTRLQATRSHAHAFRETLHGLRVMVRAQGVWSLWRGLELTLWRDVPFSGVYWLGYELVKGMLRRGKRGEEATFTDSFVAGASSGAVAAFLTTPFDVGKTRRQVGQGGMGGMGHVLREIWGREGVRGLWRGCAPRMLKVAPACAIMISSYEVGKKMAVKMNERKAHERS